MEKIRKIRYSLAMISDALSNILSLLSGIGVFLIACTMLSENLQALSSGNLRRLFCKTSNSTILGIGIGTLGTAVIQSSGATSVMAIGFVNAGIMTLKQATAIMYGASIGTTVTGQIVALGLTAEKSISTGVILSSLVGIGALLLVFSKDDRRKKVGGVIAGFGMLFVGLEVMSTAMKKLAALEPLRLFIASVSNPFLLIFLGIVITAIVQSSSVTTSIAITMLVSGLISLYQGIYLTLGANIGTCSVAILSSVSGTANSKRTALIQVFLKTFGVAVFLIAEIVFSICSSGTLSWASIFYKLFPNAAQTQLAMFHSLFNIANVVLFLPFINTLVNISTRLIKQTEEDKNKLKLYYLDYNMFKTPSVAVLQVKNEVYNMGKIALGNFNLAMDMICTMNNSELGRFQKTEQEIDFLNLEISKYVTELQRITKSRSDLCYLATTFRSVADFERIGDYAENITEYQKNLAENGDSFPKEALDEITKTRTMINSLAEHIFAAYSNRDFNEFETARKIEDEIDALTDTMADNYITRLGNGTFNANTGAQFLALSKNMERIGDHFFNVGKTINLCQND